MRCEDLKLFDQTLRGQKLDGRAHLLTRGGLTCSGLPPRSRSGAERALSAQPSEPSYSELPSLAKTRSLGEEAAAAEAKAAAAANKKKKKKKKKGGKKKKKRL